jgi:hypothetical protein
MATTSMHQLITAHWHGSVHEVVTSPDRGIRSNPFSFFEKKKRKERLELSQLVWKTMGTQVLATDTRMKR